MSQSVKIKTYFEILKPRIQVTVAYDGCAIVMEGQALTLSNIRVRKNYFDPELKSLEPKVGKFIVMLPHFTNVFLSFERK